MAKKVLVTVLDWGLGHATRCIPLIRELKRQNFPVTLGGSGSSLKLLRQEFPQLPYHEFPPYNIRYPLKNMLLNMALQAPKLMVVVLREHFLLRSILKKESFDIILSDNRLGCFSSKAYCVYITHQLNIILPFIFKKTVNSLHHWVIRQFNDCWVPDYAAGTGLSGQLSQPVPSFEACYIGPLSRMQIIDRKSRFEIIVILSGPEPQRTFLEKELIPQLRSLKLRTLIVQGKYKKENTAITSGHLTIIPFMNSDELNESICASKIVVCRSGYSSIMDLAALKKKAILIPTPGQTEQEYLAQYFDRQGIYLAQLQEKLNLRQAIQQIDQYTGTGIPPSNKLTEVIQKLEYV